VSAILRSEILKVLTVRTFLWIAVANAAFVLLGALAVVLSAGSLESAEDDRSAAQLAAVSVLLALVGGILVMAGEATHGTITQTLLVTPVRERVLFAKAAVAAALGLALAAIAELLILAIVSELNVHNARLVLLGILIAAPLSGALGVGLGAIFQGQGAAIAVSLIWLLVGESFASLLRGDTEKFTPGRSFGSLASGLESQEGMLGMTGGGVAAAVWTVVFLAAGVLVFKGRDV
jgi:ABC-2 type transport system permease protein